LVKDVEFRLETAENNVIAIEQDALCDASMLETLDISDGTGLIVMGVDTSFEE